MLHLPRRLQGPCVGKGGEGGIRGNKFAFIFKKGTKSNDEESARRAAEREDGELLNGLRCGHFFHAARGPLSLLLRSLSFFSLLSPLSPLSPLSSLSLSLFTSLLLKKDH